MESIEKKDFEPAWPDRAREKNEAWRWLFPFFGLCIAAFGCAGLGLLFWQVQAGRADRLEVDRSTLPQGDEAPAGPARTASSDADASAPGPPSRGDVINIARATPASAQQLVQSDAAPCEANYSFENLTVTKPILSHISFSTRQDSDGWPLDSALQFTTAVTKVQASFSFAGIRNGMTWERVWYFGEREILRGGGIWDAGSRGDLTVHVEAGDSGYTPGRYRVEIFIEGALLSQGSFVIVSDAAAWQQPVQVAYTSWEGNKHQINLFDLDNRTSQPLLEFGQKPTWSLDGRGLLFYGEAGIAAGTRGLWVHNVFQGRSYQLSTETSFQSLAWSPGRDYMATSVETQQQTRLMLWSLGQSKAYGGPPGEEPSWSPDGRRLAYRSCGSGRWGISTVQVIGNIFDGETIQTLTVGDDSQPVWSWDGQRIAFVRREGDNRDIYSMDSDGANLRRLTTHSAADVAPAWTPDDRLLFYTMRDGRWAIYSMAADGAAKRHLIDTSVRANRSPDRLAVNTNHRLIEPTPTPQPKPRVQVPRGHGLLVVSNRQNNDEMTFTINNHEHKVSPNQVKTLPLIPGHYTWTASWPAKVSRTGIADITLGQVSYPVVER